MGSTDYLGDIGRVCMILIGKPEIEELFGIPRT
jgi:hypothetical protein